MPPVAGPSRNGGEQSCRRWHSGRVRAAADRGDRPGAAAGRAFVTAAACAGGRTDTPSTALQGFWVQLGAFRERGWRREHAAPRPRTACLRSRRSCACSARRARTGCRPGRSPSRSAKPARPCHAVARQPAHLRRWWWSGARSASAAALIRAAWPRTGRRMRDTQAVPAELICAIATESSAISWSLKLAFSAANSTSRSHRGGRPCRVSDSAHASAARSRALVEAHLAPGRQAVDALPFLRPACAGRAHACRGSRRSR